MKFFVLLILGPWNITCGAVDLAGIYGNDLELHFVRGESVTVGTYYYLLNPNGERKGIAQVEKVETGVAWATLKMGTASAGWTVAPGPKELPALRSKVKAAPTLKKLSYTEESTSSYARDDWIIQFDTLAVWQLLARLDFEHRLSSSTSLGLVCDYSSFSFLGNSWQYQGYGLGFTYKFAPDLFDNGFFARLEAELFAEKVTYNDILLNNTSEQARSTGSAFTLDLGYQWLWHGFNISVGGYVRRFSFPGGNFITNNNVSVQRNDRFAGFYGMGEFMLGWKF
jgi:hypothetical protein